MAVYREKLQSFVYASGTTMKPIFALAKRARNKRVAYAEGEEERVLRAVQVVIDEGLARPTPWAPSVIAERCERFGLRLQEGLDYDVVNVEQDHRYRDYWQTYHRMTERKGVTEQLAKIEMRRRLTLISAMLLHKGEVDGMLCGTWSTTAMHLQYIDQVIGKREEMFKTYACMNGLILPGRQATPVDTHVNYDPTAEQLAEITVTPKSLVGWMMITLPENHRQKGHQWTDAGMVSDYVEKMVRAWFRSYPHRQADALVYNKNGFIWNQALDHGKSVRIYGEACETMYDTKRKWAYFYRDYTNGINPNWHNSSTIAHPSDYFCHLS